MTASLALADASRVRETAYRMFALLLLDPEERRGREIAAMARALRAYDAELSAYGFYIPWRRLLDALRGREAGDPPDLRREHARLFGVDHETVRCEPYESRYVTTPGQHDDGFIVAQLDQVYRRAGLRPAPGLNPRSDHAAVELEFMAHLCDREAAAWERAARADAVDALREEHAFLHLHLAAWIGELARDIRAVTRSDFYVAVADALGAFVHHDRGMVGALAAATAAHA